MMSLAVFRPVLLTLSLLLCSGSARTPHEFVEEGERIILPCKDVKDGQRECDGTTWMLKNKELITRGKIGSSVPETLSNRLRVTQNCGLEIQNVQPQDAGRFYCEQYDQSGRHLSTDDPVYLSVVSLTKEENEENVELKCQVSSVLPDVKTKWLFNGQNVNNLQLPTKNLQNGIAVTVPKSHSHYKSTDRLKCEVSHRVDKKEFSLRANKPEKTTTKTTTTQTKNGEKDTSETPSEPKPKTEAEDAQTTASPQNWSTGCLWAVIAVVAGVLVTVVVVVTWRRLREKPADTRSDATVEHEEAVSYATVSYDTNNQRIEIRQREDVTYSLVGNTTVENPAQFYATVDDQQLTQQPINNPPNNQPTTNPTTNQPTNQPKTHPTTNPTIKQPKN